MAASKSPHTPAVETPLVRVKVLLARVDWVSAYPVKADTEKFAPATTLELLPSAVAATPLTVNTPLTGGVVSSLTIVVSVTAGGTSVLLPVSTYR